MIELPKPLSMKSKEDEPVIFGIDYVHPYLPKRKYTTSLKVKEARRRQKVKDPVARQLYQLRKQKDLSLITMGDILDVAPSACYSYEVGRVKLPEHKIQLLENYFNVNISRETKLCAMCKCSIAHKNRKAVYCSKQCKNKHHNTKKQKSKFKNRIKVPAHKIKILERNEK